MLGCVVWFPVNRCCAEPTWNGNEQGLYIALSFSMGNGRFLYGCRVKYVGFFIFFIVASNRCSFLSNCGNDFIGFLWPWPSLLWCK